MAKSQLNMNPGKQQKFDYTLAVLNDTLRKEENNLDFWKKVIDNPSSDSLSLRQAKGNLSGTENRVKELKSVLLILDPPREEPTTKEQGNG